MVRWKGMRVTTVSSTWIYQQQAARYILSFRFMLVNLLLICVAKFSSYWVPAFELEYGRLCDCSMSKRIGWTISTSFRVWYCLWAPQNIRSLSRFLLFLCASVYVPAPGCTSTARNLARDFISSLCSFQCFSHCLGYIFCVYISLLLRIVEICGYSKQTLHLYMENICWLWIVCDDFSTLCCAEEKMWDNEQICQCFCFLPFVAIVKVFLVQIEFIILTLENMCWCLFSWRKN